VYKYLYRTHTWNPFRLNLDTVCHHTVHKNRNNSRWGLFPQSYLFSCFVLSYYMSLPSEFHVVVSVAISHKNDVRPHPQLLIGRKYRRSNQKWTIHRNWQHRVHKMKKNKNKTQHNMCLTPIYSLFVTKLRNILSIVIILYHIIL
jgi:hypothetical protein